MNHVVRFSFQLLRAKNRKQNFKILADHITSGGRAASMFPWLKNYMSANFCSCNKCPFWSFEEALAKVHSASGNEWCVLRGELLVTSNYNMHEWVCVPKSGQFGVFSGNSLLVLLFFVLYINCHVFSVIYTLSYLCANISHIIFCRDIWNKICL